MRSRTPAWGLHKHSKICSLARESNGKRILASGTFEVPAANLKFNIYLITSCRIPEDMKNKPKC